MRHIARIACVRFLMVVQVVINEFEPNLWQPSHRRCECEQRNSIALMNEWNVVGLFFAATSTAEYIFA